MGFGTRIIFGSRESKGELMNIPRRINLVWILAFSLASASVAQKTLVLSAVEEGLTVAVAERILKEAYQKIGITLEIRALPGSRGLFYSNTAHTDGEAFRIEGIDKDYPNLCRIDIPIFTNSLYLLVEKGREFTVDGWDSIPKGYRVGYQRGVQVIKNCTLEHRIETEQARNAGQLFTMLKFGRVDAVVAGQYQISASAEKIEREHMVQLQPAVHSHPLYHYLHVKHAGLIPRITAVLREMQSRGELQQIRKEVEAAHSQAQPRLAPTSPQECKAP